jgi:GH24 family phage-related lysozyme (muramidase)
MIVRERIGYDMDSLLIDHIVRSVDEGMGESFSSIVNKFTNKRQALITAIKKFNSSRDYAVKRKIAKIIVVLTIVLYGSGKTFSHLRNDYAAQDKISEKIANDQNTAIDKVIDYFQELLKGEEPKIEKPVVQEVKFKDASEFTTSQEAIDTIKHHEQLKLKAYKIKGDKKITVGWGHAEPIRKSKFKLGQRITKEKAEQLFQSDLKIAEDGVKRIFAQWKEQGNDVKITQGMFDAMVSISFNAGISGLRQSEFIQLVKRGKFKEAGEKIHGLRNTGKFGGLDVRRKVEKYLFHKDLAQN